jgi:hypothetical protein
MFIGGLCRMMSVEICDWSRRTYVGCVRREGTQCRTVVHVKENSLLQEFLSHNVDEDTASDKQKLSRSPNRLSVARERVYSR